VNMKWPRAKWHREMPMMHRLDTGSVVRGICDLALETKDGWVVVDHKTYQAVEKAAGPAAQLKAYAEGIAAATKKPLLGCYVHLPVAGVLVPVESALPQ
jgi:ATP-dependent helicase/nuclease subunit A